MNASFVPMEYIQAVLEHCSYFPNQLIFFLKGDLQVSILTLFGHKFAEHHYVPYQFNLLIFK